MGWRGAFVRNLPYIFTVLKVNPSLKPYTGENENNSIVVRNHLEPSSKSLHANVTHTDTPRYFLSEVSRDERGSWDVKCLQTLPQAHG